MAGILIALGSFKGWGFSRKACQEDGMVYRERAEGTVIVRCLMQAVAGVESERELSGSTPTSWQMMDQVKSNPLLFLRIKQSGVIETKTVWGLQV
jgi:hypothetical protein